MFALKSIGALLRGFTRRLSFTVGVGVSSSNGCFGMVAEVSAHVLSCMTRLWPVFLQFCPRGYGYCRLATAYLVQRCRLAMALPPSGDSCPMEGLAFVAFSETLCSSSTHHARAHYNTNTLLAFSFPTHEMLCTRHSYCAINTSVNVAVTVAVVACL